MNGRRSAPTSSTALPALRLLVTTGMANASIDLTAAARQGVTVCGTGGSGNAMPELTIGMMIALTRNFAQEDAAVRAGGWQHTIGPGLAGSTLGIVGLGRLGVPVANLAHAFGMDVVAWSPNLTQERADPHGVRAVGKHELFETADVVTIHMPLSDASRGLIGAADLALMKPSAYLINTSRARSSMRPRCSTCFAPGASPAPGSTSTTSSRSPPITRCARCPTRCCCPTSATSPATTTGPSTATSSRTSSRYTAGTPIRVLASPS